MHRQSNNFIPVIDEANSPYDSSGSLQAPERRLNRSVVELLLHLDETRLERSEPENQDIPSSLELEDNEPHSTSSSDFQVSRSTAPLVRICTFSDRVQAQVVNFPELQGLDDQRNSFHNWLISTVILDDLSYREPFIDSARDANQLTEEDLFYRALGLYENADLMRPQELVDLPFLPCAMRTGDTLLDIPFLDPLLIVVWCLHLEEVHWMLNVLPWRVVDRHIRTGRSILAWITGIPNIHEFLEDTRAPLSIVVKLIRFLDIYNESLDHQA
nr:BV-like protein [Cotesia vestalis bracovirus]